MPVKFDDIGKAASEQLNDDYQTSGYVLKTKHKAFYGKAELSTQVDVFPGSDSKAVATPSKLTWKWPNPFGVKQAFIDKLELDKGGKFKLEASSGEVHPGLKLECKSDLADLNKVLAGFTYTGIKNAQVKFETKALNPADFSGEATYEKDLLTFGLKVNSSILKGGAPDMGVRVNGFVGCGVCVASLVAKEKFKALNASVYYKASADLKCAATYTQGGSDSGKYVVGVHYKNFVKAKLTQDQTLSWSVKHTEKGITMIGGASYNLKSSKTTGGLQVSIA